MTVGVGVTFGVGVTVTVGVGEGGVPVSIVNVFVNVQATAEPLGTPDRISEEGRLDESFVNPAGHDEPWKIPMNLPEIVATPEGEVERVRYANGPIKELLTGGVVLSGALPNFLTSSSIAWVVVSFALNVVLEGAELN